ncbi:CIA30 family protein [Halomonas sp. ANAO-440]|uniref:CIA30 family protein n=1 Tax=Halomonas sp. ANAO-440 TaxID=2861360 RepID=UPI001CAA7D8C|nr:CIA30 family protein [Halomonas sp. ANAO-440]MBZ0331407.1 CIA30 family protein [Halomonas sp. ANAO-440]
MPTLIDFSAGNEVPRWRAINDTVMGGGSRGAMHAAGALGIFSGELSLTNGGGFASVRREPEPMRLSRHQGVTVEARGDGRQYQLRLYSNQLIDGAAYRAVFQPPAGEWQRIALPWSMFEAVFRGRLFEDAPPLAPDEIQQLGLLIADRRDGAFRLEVASIETLEVS